MTVLSLNTSMISNEETFVLASCSYHLTFFYVLSKNFAGLRGRNFVNHIHTKKIRLYKPTLLLRGGCYFENKVHVPCYKLIFCLYAILNGKYRK